MKKMRIDDSMLESPAQDRMRELVSSLPEDSLSLAWRSQLNERLLESAGRSRRRSRMLWVLKPSLGLAMAGALAAVVMLKLDTVQPVVAHQNSGLEAALVQDHRSSVELTDMVGAGLNPLESHPTSSYAADGSDWNEVDLDSL